MLGTATTLGGIGRGVYLRVQSQGTGHQDALCDGAAGDGHGCIPHLLLPQLKDAVLQPVADKHDSWADLGYPGYQGWWGYWGYKGCRRHQGY